jgi:GT2 family glycosyltransferase/glycosyltransferase involved in cell wall biosynthesis
MSKSLLGWLAAKLFFSDVESKIDNPKPTATLAKIKEVFGTEFDTVFYLKSNYDVEQAGVDPLEHFVNHGWREGRKPNILFDCRFYLESNKDVAQADINPFYHYLTEGRVKGNRPNPVGSQLYPAMKSPALYQWQDVAPAVAVGEAAYVVIMPVYKGYNETLASIYAVLTSPQTTTFALHVVNDKSPDDELNQILKELAERGLFSYIENEENLGFVKSVNGALRQFADKEVVLLNSDAQVFSNWIDRMVAHAHRDPSIATITAMSNNATICSYPLPNDNNLIEMECSAEELDALAAVANDGRVSEIPTGVGFCFYMSKASRAAIGLLDEESFGRGYGEENDFCLRASKAGFSNMLAEDIFVYHAGQVSFAEFAASEYGPGQIALLGKHPDYPVRLKQHFDADPSAWGRMRLDLMRMMKDAGPKSMVFVYHALMGGVVTHVRHMEERLRQQGITVIHLRVGVNARWNVEITSGSETAPFCPNLGPVAFNHFRPLLKDFLAWLGPLGIHIHSLVGFDWSTTAGLLELIQASAIPYYFTLHDYSVVCHRNDLVMPSGRYCGLPHVSVCQTCAATDRTYPEALDPVVRRYTYAEFLAGAACVFAPSEDIKRRLQSAGACYAISVRPHEETAADAPVLRPPLKPAQIDVITLGAIGVHKGSHVLLNMARDAKARALPIRFHIIGYSDVTDEMIAAGVNETGRYRSEDEAFEAARLIKPSCAFLPSIWPETFCYALSMAFRLEIPPVVFDIGAQRDRVIEQDFGFVLPYDLIDDVQGLNDRLLRLPYTTAFFDRRKLTIDYYQDLARGYYQPDYVGNSPAQSRKVL